MILKKLSHSAKFDQNISFVESESMLKYWHRGNGFTIIFSFLTGILRNQNWVINFNLALLMVNYLMNKPKHQQPRRGEKLGKCDLK